MKTNYTTKAVKSFRAISNKTAKGMNYCKKVVLSVWDNTNNGLGLSAAELAELKAMKEAAKADGLSRKDFENAAEYIKAWLEGTNYCQGGVIGSLRKGEGGEKVFAAKIVWTPAQLIDYVRRANRARLVSAATTGKGERTAKEVSRKAAK